MSEVRGCAGLKGGGVDGRARWRVLREGVGGSEPVPLGKEGDVS